MNIFASKSEVIRSRHELEFSLVPFQTLSAEYVMDGGRVHFENMQHRLIHERALIDLDEEFRYIFVFGMHFSRMKDRLGDARLALEVGRCKEIVELLLMHGLKPYKPRECFGGRSIIERYSDTDLRHNRFFIDCLMLFVPIPEWARL